MNNWTDFEFDQTIHDFEYTRRAVLNMNAIVNSTDFESMDADMIFDYLKDQIQIVIFPDFLKRYLYKKVELDISASEVSDMVYADIIKNSYEYNKAPASLGSANIKLNNFIKGLLKNPTVKRKTIFSLGFGLKMTAEDVSIFLTKVILEQDFDFTDPYECIYWFCFNKGLAYAEAKKLIDEYNNLESNNLDTHNFKAIYKNPRLYLITKHNLMRYLSFLKDSDLVKKKQNRAYEVFNELYTRCKNAVACIYNKEREYDENSESKDEIKPEDISTSDIEKILCSGMPVNRSGNLENLNASSFKYLFKAKRMSRQRITEILNKKHEIERFDLISMLFLLYAVSEESNWRVERFMKFVDEINVILTKCDMYGIYPVNPYEAFVLMCLLSEYPLDTYSEVWTKSFEQ